MAYDALVTRDWALRLVAAKQGAKFETLEVVSSAWRVWAYGADACFWVGGQTYRYSGSSKIDAKVRDTLACSSESVSCQVLRGHNVTMDT